MYNKSHTANRSVLHGWNRQIFSSITEEEGEFINLF